MLNWKLWNFNKTMEQDSKTTKLNLIKFLYKWVWFLFFFFISFFEHFIWVMSLANEALPVLQVLEGFEGSFFQGLSVFLYLYLDL